MIGNLEPITAEAVAVLITDDDTGDRMDIRRSLMESGVSCDCVEAASVDEALAACARRSFDCAIIDYGLPGIDGLDGVSTLHEQYPNLFLVMATGGGDAVIATEAMKRGASDYIAKQQITGKSLARIIDTARSKEAVRRKLSQQREELERFADVLVHDLKSPVTSIRGFATIISQAVRSGSADPGKIAGYCHRVVQLGERMVTLIETLYQYTQSDAQVRFEAVDLNRVVDDARGNLEQAIGTRGARVTWDELPLVSGNSALLTQLFQNLIGNGIKYCEADPPIVHIDARLEAGDIWRVSVRDNGIGIPEDAHALIFQPFKRLHDRTRYDGTGLGLATCKKIVERHGGQIGCMPGSETGSIFYFTFPNNTLAGKA